MEKKILNNLEDYFKIHKEINPYFTALKTYLEIPGIFSPSAFVVLTHFFSALSPESKIVFKSYQNIKEFTCLEFHTIRTALKELYLKGMISYISGRYDKELAFKTRKLKFEEKAKRCRSHYEINAYDLSGALKFGQLIQYFKNCANEKKISVNYIKEMVIKICQIFEVYTCLCYEKAQNIKIKTFLELLRQLGFKDVISLSNQIVTFTDLLENPDKLLKIWESLTTLKESRSSSWLRQLRQIEIDQIYQTLTSLIESFPLNSLSISKKSEPSGIQSNQSNKKGVKLPLNVKKWLLAVMEKDKNIKNPAGLLKSMDLVEIEDYIRKHISEIVPPDEKEKEFVRKLLKEKRINLIDAAEFFLLEKNEKVKWIKDKDFESEYEKYVEEKNKNNETHKIEEKRKFILKNLIEIGQTSPTRGYKNWKNELKKLIESGHDKELIEEVINSKLQKWTGRELLYFPFLKIRELLDEIK